MNPVSGNDILSYQGNAALGLNSDGLAQYGETDAKLLNESMFNLAYTNMNRNKVIYEQKIKDRDDAFGLIASGKLQLDQVREKDRPELMKRLDEVKSIFLSKNGDIKSDPATYLKFTDAMAKFNEADVYAKHRYLEIGKQEAEMAQTKRPDLKEAMARHIKQMEDQDLYKEVTPYQQTLDYMPESLFVLGQAKSGQKEEAATGKLDQLGNVIMDGSTGRSGGTSKAAKPEKNNTDRFYNITTTKSKDGFTNTTTGVLDFDKIRQDVAINYQKDNGIGSFYETNKAVNDYLGGDKTGDIITEANKAIDRYNQVRKSHGFTGPDVTPIVVQRDEQGNVVRDQQGNVISPDTIPTLKAKLNLMGVPFKLTNTTADKDALEVAKGKSLVFKNEAAGKKDLMDAGSNRIKANAYKAAQESVKRKNDVQSKVFAQTFTPAQYFDEIKGKTTLAKLPDGKSLLRINAGDMTEGLKKYLGIDHLTSNNNKDKFYNVAVSKISVGGQPLNADQISQTFDKYLKSVNDPDIKYKGSFFDYLDMANAEYDYEVVGRKKGTKDFSRSNRLNTFDNQTKEKNKKSLFLTDEQVPDDIKE